jgi:hypothetical protein
MCAMNPNLLIFENGLVILAQIEETGSDLGEPDCKITEPFVVNSDNTLSPWLLEYSVQNSYKVHSDKILTITVPNEKLLQTYKSLIK